MLDTTVSTKLVPLGTNWKQEFCYRGPPRTKRHSVSECRNPPPAWTQIKAQPVGTCFIVLFFFITILLQTE